MRIYQEIKEGQIVLHRCQGGCGFWYLEVELCLNEETFKLQCAECYTVWQAEQEEYDDDYTQEEIDEMYNQGFDPCEDDGFQDSSSFEDEDM